MDVHQLARLFETVVRFLIEVVVPGAAAIVVVPLEAAILSLFRWGPYRICLRHAFIADAITIPFALMVSEFLLERWCIRSMDLRAWPDLLVAVLCSGVVGGSVRHFASKPKVWGRKNLPWMGVYGLASVPGAVPRTMLPWMVADMLGHGL